jgi:hypothetical protein
MQLATQQLRQFAEDFAPPAAIAAQWEHRGEYRPYVGVTVPSVS